MLIDVIENRYFQCNLTRFFQCTRYLLTYYDHLIQRLWNYAAYRRKMSSEFFKNSAEGGQKIYTARA